MNERITENITRKLLEEAQYNKENGFIVEEQKTKSKAIENLLKSASKSGNGRGYPEFIITQELGNDLDVVIVIECKADIRKHSSNTENFEKINDFAVDGAIHYGKALSKRYNVIAVGISGQNEKELLIDMYFINKEIGKITKIDNNNILLPYNILKGETPIEKQEIKEKEKALMAFASELHNDMRDYAKLSEEQKPLLVSAVLIALKDPVFKVSYKKNETPKKLSKALLQSVISSFEDSGLEKDKIESLKQSFSFITVQPQLNTDKVLFNLIEKIDNNLYSLLGDQYSHIDVIGKFYGEFLKYTGGDGKGLGIVLTPRHITELFCDIANINKDSKVIDTCQGTGGFLISAMDRMVKDAKGDEAKIKEIKTKQLIGCEQQPHMYTLGTSNMILRGDEKPNVYMGSCFDLTEDLKKHKPNVGFINPPYSQKGDGLSELDFIEHMLDIVEPGGKVVAIVPISIALDTNNPIRKRILEKHTLDAVFSMPDDLFYPVATVTCIMVFNVGTKHPDNFKTFFGYYKNDGFIKTRNEGRVDIYHKFEDEIKDKWINAYRNREDITGFTVKQAITADDEWVAEAYMETDYSDLNSDIFKSEIRKYMAYILENEVQENNTKKGDIND